MSFRFHSIRSITVIAILAGLFTSNLSFASAAREALRAHLLKDGPARHIEPLKEVISASVDSRRGAAAAAWAVELIGGGAHAMREHRHVDQFHLIHPFLEASDHFLSAARNLRTAEDGSNIGDLVTTPHIYFPRLDHNLRTYLDSVLALRKAIEHDPFPFEYAVGQQGFYPVSFRGETFDVDGDLAALFRNLFTENVPGESGFGNIMGIPYTPQDYANYGLFDFLDPMHIQLAQVRDGLNARVPFSESMKKAQELLATRFGSHLRTEEIAMLVDSEMKRVTDEMASVAQIYDDVIQERAREVTEAAKTSVSPVE